MSTDLCPWLGTFNDREIRHADPSELHLCYAQARPAEIDLDYQAQLCLTGEHGTCRFYREPPPSPAPSAPAGSAVIEDEIGPPPGGFPLLRVILWAVVVLAAAAVVYYYGSSLIGPSSPSGQSSSPLDMLSPAPGATPTPTSLGGSGIPSPTFSFSEATATPTPYPGGTIVNLSPKSGKVGWVASDESRGNHLGDSYLYAGVFDGVIYHGVLQFDLSAVPRGARIYAAVLELTGLDDRRLGASGVWEVRVLSREVDEDWSLFTFQDVHNSPIQWTVPPALGVGDVHVGKTNALELPEEVRRDLEVRLLQEHYTVSFRIDGPLAGENSVFAWDSGQGPASQWRAPFLFLSIGAPPLTPLPSGTPPFVVVTSTPTPANVLTAAAYVQTATAVALTTGQPTPTSVYEWTATPIYVVTSTPTPANQATADQNSAIATAIALTTGTFTPTPVQQVTATPTPLSIAEEDLTPTPPPLPPPPIPEALRGKILFQSDRAGGTGPWVMDADGYGISLLTSSWPYDVAARREALSPDGTRLVYGGEWEGQPAVLIRPLESRQGQPVVVFEQGQISSPVWSPTRNQIAFVSTSGGSAQIWLVNVDGGGLRQLTPSAGGSVSHPSFSPDGNRLVYASAGGFGLRQVWIISVDGTGRANISNNLHDEWNPIWAK